MCVCVYGCVRAGVNQTLERLLMFYALQNVHYYDICIIAIYTYVCVCLGVCLCSLDVQRSMLHSTPNKLTKLYLRVVVVLGQVFKWRRVTGDPHTYNMLLYAF